MRRDVVTAGLAIVVITLVFGLAYPLVVTGVSQVLLPGRSNGSKIVRDGKLLGSRLLAQDFRVPVKGRDGKPKVDKAGDPVLRPALRYFQPRPSTATSYNPAQTAFTNLGPNAKAARDTFRSSLEGYLQLERRYDPGLTARGVPVDAVTSSASGVDPHISAANAAIQAHRVAAVRRLPLSRVRQLIDENTDGRFLGVIGETGVNVLELNLALDRQSPR